MKPFAGRRGRHVSGGVCTLEQLPPAPGPPSPPLVPSLALRLPKARSLTWASGPLVPLPGTTLQAPPDTQGCAPHVSFLCPPASQTRVTQGCVALACGLHQW